MSHTTPVTQDTADAGLNYSSKSLSSSSDSELSSYKIKPKYKSAVLANNKNKKLPRTLGGIDNTVKISKFSFLPFYYH